MKTRSNTNRSVMETLEGRSLMSVTATADLNNDGRVDKVEVTNPTTITVSLQQADGSYAVSAILTASKNNSSQVACRCGSKYFRSFMRPW